MRLSDWTRSTKMAKARDYKKEYKRDHSSTKDKKDRAARNKAHREEDPPAGYEVDHKKPLSKGGSNGKSIVRKVLEMMHSKRG